jgi:hypothetical protein
MGIISIIRHNLYTYIKEKGYKYKKKNSRENKKSNILGKLNSLIDTKISV